MQNGRFSCKIALRLKKVRHKVFLCKTVINLSIRAKMIGGEEYLADDPPTCKSPIFNLFSLVAPHP